MIKHFFPTIIGFCCLMCIPLISCVHHPDYPIQWAKFEELESKDCPEITGTYVDMGENAPYEYGLPLPSLSKILLPSSDNLDAVTHIVIVQPNRRILKIEGWEGKCLVFRQIFSSDKGQLRCISGMLELSTVKEFWGDLAVGVESGTPYLTKALDGSLVVKQTRTFIGVFSCILPVMATGWDWHRFKQRTEVLEE